MDMYRLDYVSIDGSKFRAVNSKDRNFTLSKLDDRLKRLDAHIDEYLVALEESDGDDVRKLSRREVEGKLAALLERKASYEGYLRQLEEGGESQMSLTDPDARLMKENNGFGVGYNVQTAVDAESHLIAGFVVTNHPTDHGLITEVAVEVKDDMGLETLEATADKGYHDPDDMASALENGVVPSVIQNGGASVVDVEYGYEGAEPTEGQRLGTTPEDIKACLHAGVVPYCLKGVLTDASVEEVTLRHREQTDAEVSRMTLEQMIAKAHEGYQGRRAKPGHLPAGRDTAAEVLEEKRRHQVLQQAGLQALQVKVHHVQVQGGGLLEGLSDQESRREERRRQARRQRPAIEVGDRKESGRPVQAPHGREEDGQPQMPFGTSVRNHQADNRRGLLPAAQDVQDRGRDGPALPCVQHAEGDEYADDGRAGGRDGRMMVRKPRSRAR